MTRRSEIVTWPESQNYMGFDDFDEHSALINDEKGIEAYGSSAYYIETDWMEKADERLKKGIYYGKVLTE